MMLNRKMNKMKMFMLLALMVKSTRNYKMKLVEVVKAEIRKIIVHVDIILHTQILKIYNNNNES